MKHGKLPSLIANPETSIKILVALLKTLLAKKVFKINEYEDCDCTQDDYFLILS